MFSTRHVLSALDLAAGDDELLASLAEIRRYAEAPDDHRLVVPPPGPRDVCLETRIVTRISIDEDGRPAGISVARVGERELHAFRAAHRLADRVSVGDAVFGLWSSGYVQGGGPIAVLHCADEACPHPIYVSDADGEGMRVAIDGPHLRIARA